MFPVRVILHPTDFSPPSEQAFKLACSLAREARGRLIVLHVLERPVIVQSGVAMAPPPPPPSEEERKAVLAQLHQVRPADPALPVEYRLEEGDPATAVLQVAREAGCDLIVLGTHGRTGLARLLMGSVAERVVRGADCPVLTLKAPLPKAQPQATQ
jgi:nucleotide-binding universal stress UspA family protein